MKILIYRLGQGSHIEMGEMPDSDSFLEIRIKLSNGREISFSPSDERNADCLRLRSPEGCMIVEPEASNTIVLRPVPWNYDAILRKTVQVRRIDGRFHKSKKVISGGK